MPTEQLYRASQWIPLPIDKVFPFFASEMNLEKLTPPWLNFKVVNKSTVDMGKGTLINYRLSLYGIPFRWQTLIETWEPGQSFVDTQLRGPYSKWHHTHTFTAENGGTRMIDEVRYKVPFGLLGHIIAGWKVKKQVSDIFEYRRQMIEEIFGKSQGRHL